ncbi:hypothetical protein BCR33DRAFT_445765 [Rhizoclosmatium globosum]|uniref:Uncharacterized protein n=1 Tax=Rhizoclosmatium globosum TaxID=329046 RepID=A0A1Y2BSP4_9FUNG|nr:hypothetical protein BCR33DRAFT_445765 [Rhizoclosmatium globosum]|eukprot:ORY37770.1 hypothetical protein BCR33DRAFT_445765 [Rhizoclosmatium globosum]
MKGFSTKTPKSGWFPSTLVTLAPGESIPGWSPTTKIRTKKVNPVVEVPVLNESPSVPVPSEPKSEPPAAPEPANESTTVDVTPPEQPDDTASNDTPLESTKNELSRSIFLDSEVASAHRVKSDPSIVGNTSPAPTPVNFHWILQQIS